MFIVFKSSEALHSFKSAMFRPLHAINSMRQAKPFASKLEPRTSHS